MATRNSRNSSRTGTSRATTDVGTEAGAAGAEKMQEGTTQQLALAAHAGSAMLHGAELLQRAQVQMLSTGAASLRNAAERLRTAKNWMDLISIQNDFLMTTYLAGLQTGNELLQGWTQLQPEQMRPVQEETATMADAVAPMVQAWQNMFDATAAASRAPH